VESDEILKLENRTEAGIVGGLAGLLGAIGSTTGQQALAVGVLTSVFFIALLVGRNLM